MKAIGVVVAKPPSNVHVFIRRIKKNAGHVAGLFINNSLNMIPMGLFELRVFI